jgi:hypothetical protein
MAVEDDIKAEEQKIAALKKQEQAEEVHLTEMKKHADELRKKAQEGEAAKKELEGGGGTAFF